LRRSRSSLGAVLAGSYALFAVAVAVGFAVGGGVGAIRAAALTFGLLMLGLAAQVVVLALRTGHDDEDWAVLAGYVVLRAGSGVAAIWLALGGGATAGWCLVAFVVAYPIWQTVMRRRRGVT
jgi:hypothetical protein